MATTHEIIQEYRHLRAKGQPAQSALRLARTTEQTQQTLPWEPTHGRDAVKQVRLEREGFTCRLTISYDFDHDFSEFCGTFTNDPSEEAIENPNHRHERGTYRYFVPEITVAEHRDALSKMGIARGEAEEQARKYVHEDLLIALDPEKQGMMAYGVIATVTLEGVELANSSLWGIEIGDRHYDNDPYLEACALEQLEDALRQAKKVLVQLQKH